MTVWAQRYRIGNAVRAFLRQMLYMMNFKKRQTINFERCDLTTAFTDTFRQVSHPCPDLRVTDVGRCGNANLLWVRITFRCDF
ncbi:hypothetical protein D3C84_858350 [compost metagenome]